MKLTSIYNFLKTQIEAIEEINLITWWNGQDADNIIHTVPAVYIEFPDTLPTSQMSNQRMQNTELTVRVMLVNKLLTNNAGEVSDNIIANHEEQAMQIFEALQGKQMEFDENNTAINSLVRKSIQLNLSTPGMVITIQDFRCLAILQDRRNYTEVIPNINLIKQT